MSQQIHVPVTEGQEISAQRINKELDYLSENWPELRELLGKADLDDRKTKEWISGWDRKVAVQISDDSLNFFSNLKKALGCKSIGRTIALFTFASSLDDIALMIRSLGKVKLKNTSEVI